LVSVCFDGDDVFGPDMFVFVVLEAVALVVDIANIKRLKKVLEIIKTVAIDLQGRTARVERIPGQLLDSTRLEPASTLNEFIELSK
jgi:hypothetical protein